MFLSVICAAHYFCFQIVGIFSMKPLLGREGLLVPCLVCTILYIVLSVVSVIYEYQSYLKYYLTYFAEMMMMNVSESASQVYT